MRNPTPLPLAALPLLFSVTSLAWMPVPIDLAPPIGSGCRVAEKAIISPLPARREQGHLGYCGAMAVSTVLDHLICRSEPQLCGPRQKPIVSVLDLVKRGYDDLSGGEHPLNLLNKIKGQSGLATESCAPFERLRGADWAAASYSMQDIYTGEIRPLASKERDYAAYEELLNVYDRLIDQMGDQRTYTHCELGESLRRIADLRPSETQIDRASRARSSKEFFQAILVPDRCEASQVKVPDFEVRMSELPERSWFQTRIKKMPSANYSWVEPQIQAQLRQNNPMIWAFIEDPSLSEAGHAAVLMGFQKVCCGRGCTIRYLVRDSDDVVGGAPGDYWITGESFLKKIAEYVSSKAECEAHDIDGTVHPCLGAIVYVIPKAKLRSP